jgi:hypothetical protein
MCYRCETKQEEHRYRTEWEENPALGGEVTVYGIFTHAGVLWLLERTLGRGESMWKLQLHESWVQIWLLQECGLRQVNSSFEASVQLTLKWDQKHLPPWPAYYLTHSGGSVDRRPSPWQQNWISTALSFGPDTPLPKAVSPRRTGEPWESIQAGDVGPLALTKFCYLETRTFLPFCRETCWVPRLSCLIPCLLLCCLSAWDLGSRIQPQLPPPDCQERQPLHLRELCSLM